MDSMGIDSFKTELSSSSSNQSQSKGSPHTTRSSSDGKDAYFTAVVDQQFEAVKVFEGKSAFPRNCRYKHEKILCIVEGEDEYTRLDDISLKYTDRSLKDLFKVEPEKAQDIVDRYRSDNLKVKTSICPICSDEIDMQEDDYTKVFNEIVHAGHDVKTVVDELGDD